MCNLCATWLTLPVAGVEEWLVEVTAAVYDVCHKSWS